MKPVTPQDAFETAAGIPPRVLKVWNKLILKGRNGNSSVVFQSDALEALAAEMDVPRSQVLEEGWLEIEPAFESAGWNVEYDKPGYNESYPATFTFTRK